MSTTPPPFPFSESELIEQLKGDLAEPLFAAASGKLQELALAKMKIHSLEERLRLQRIAKYGPGSEKLSNAQLELLELEPGVSGMEVEAESGREETVTTTRKRPGRRPNCICLENQTNSSKICYRPWKPFYSRIIQIRTVWAVRRAPRWNVSPSSLVATCPLIRAS